MCDVGAAAPPEWPGAGAGPRRTEPQRRCRTAPGRRSRAAAGRSNCRRNVPAQRKRRERNGNGRGRRTQTCASVICLSGAGPEATFASC